MEKTSRIVWNTYESVLLVNKYHSIKDMAANQRQQEIDSVSLALRERAFFYIGKIDSYYRNSNGIRMQMDVVKYLETDKQKGLSGASIILREAAKLYESDFVRFLGILTLAKAWLYRRDTNEKLFFQWLVKEYGAEYTLKGYGLYGDIELSAVENSGLRKSIFLTSADEYNQLNNLISDHVKSSKKRAIMDYISFRKMG